MNQQTLTVNGMSCGHCVSAIETNVGELAGVEQVKVNLADKKVDLAYSNDQVTLDQIIEVIEDQGYEVVRK